MPRPAFSPRLLGLYALSRMEREGTTYGFQIARRISDRTGGTWRPGPGTVYPALDRLVDRGLARRARRGRRQVYTITPEGRSLLRSLRRESGGGSPGAPDLAVLWADIIGSPDTGQFLLQRLRRTIDGVASFLDRDGASRAEDAALRSLVLGELRLAVDRFQSPSSRRGEGPRARRR
jgi:DNA-binding PadR family transcriptional regulator